MSTNGQTRTKPEVVIGVSEAIQVACGASHTLVLARKTKQVIYSFGMSDGGRLGHGGKTENQSSSRLKSNHSVQGEVDRF